MKASPGYQLNITLKDIIKRLLLKDIIISLGTMFHNMGEEATQWEKSVPTLEKIVRDTPTPRFRAPQKKTTLQKT